MNAPGWALRPLRGPFTLRGAAFLFAGIAGLVTPALINGWSRLDRVGAMLLALPLLGAWSVRRAEHNLSATRVIEPARVQVGEEAVVALSLENASTMAVGRVVVEDVLPPGMSIRPRFVIDRLEPRGTREVRYPIRSEVRGRYRVGPLTIRVGDPFGMCEAIRPFSGTADLIVVPIVHHIPQVLLGGEWAGGNDDHPSFIRSAGEDDIGIREYQYGDPLHRVNWRATARRGELMVRLEEQPRQSRATILLDTRANAHHGEGARSSLEWDISAAASVAVHLIRSGFSLRVITESGSGLAGPASDLLPPVPDVEGLLLDGLADVRPGRLTDLREAGLALGRSGDSLVIAVLGSLSDQDASDLAHRRGGTTTAIAVLLRTWTWGTTNSDATSEAQFARNVAVLRNAGWRIVPASAGDKLADLWPLAARGGASAARSEQAGAGV